MRFARRRSDRPDTSRRRLASNLEMLEGRELMTGGLGPYYQATNLYPVHHSSTPSIKGPNNTSFDLTPKQIANLTNEGKLVMGQNRQGDQYIIRLTGPGTIIVTDATPNDGVLDDDINTIQIIGSDPNKTIVNGQVITSSVVFSSSEVLFEKLVATTGVRSIVLNGFTLAQTVTPPLGVPNNTDTGIYLYGGVGVLQFHNINAPIDLATGDAPINIQIGTPNSPITQRPVIRLDEIFNTVFNSTATTVPTTPQVTPTVSIYVNGELHGLELISSTQQPIAAASQYLFPIVGTTGRTSIQTKGVDVAQAAGSLTNVTISRNKQPFTNGLSSLNHVGKLRLGANADGLAIDNKGPIKSLLANKGIGSPVGASKSATQLGTPTDRYGYPANGLVGGLITGSKVGRMNISPANTFNLTNQNPQLIQIRQGTTNYYPVAGNALTSTTIMTTGSIGKTTIVGNLANSEIKTGSSYPSLVAGLEPVRAASHIRPIAHRGNTVDSVVSSTYRPNSSKVYGGAGSVAGPGSQKGISTASTVTNGGTTILGNTGSGYYARTKVGVLPPPGSPRRVNGRLVR